MQTSAVGRHARGFYDFFSLLSSFFFSSLDFYILPQQLQIEDGITSCFPFWTDLFSWSLSTDVDLLSA